MLYIITDSKIQSSYEDLQYPIIKNENNVFYSERRMSISTIDENNITSPTTYTLTYQEKLDSLRFKRDWILDRTDKGVAIDSPLTEEKLSELKLWREDLRNFTQFIAEDNIDTYLLPEPSEWIRGWFKI